MRNLSWALLMCAFAIPSNAQQETILYKAGMIQAAPGKLLDLIDLEKKMTADAENSPGDPAPLWMRHSQGDRWDLLILYPIGNYSEYYQPERIAKRAQADVSVNLGQKFQQDIAWQEDLFVSGPDLALLRKAFAEGAFFHVEMFVALPGKLAELKQERIMENSYARALKQPENFIFVRDQGAAWVMGQSRFPQTR